MLYVCRWPSNRVSRSVTTWIASTGELQRVGSMMTVFFTEGPVTDYESAAASDGERFAAFFRGMLDRGVYIAPSRFEALFVSLAHGAAEVEATVEAARASLADLK